MTLPIEQRDALAREAVQIAAAIDLCQRALVNNASITSLEASDAAQSYRSVVFPFSAEESAPVFQTALETLNSRLTAINAALAK